MIGTEKTQKTGPREGIELITKNQTVSRLRTDATKEVKVEDARVHTEPVIVPTRIKFLILGNREISDSPIHEDRNGLPCMRSKGFGVFLKQRHLLSDNANIAPVIELARLAALTT